MAGLAGSLLVFSGLWRIFEFLMDGPRRDTLRLIPPGVVFVAVGSMIVTLRGGDITIYAALAIAAADLAYTWLTSRIVELRRWVIRVFLLIDLAIVASLILAILR